MNFEVNVSNIGLADSQNSSLQIYSGNQKIAEYYLNELEIGRTKSLSVSNLFASERSENLKFVVITNEDEISKDNNEAVLQLQSS
jgi:subtilase family serine protease